MSSVDRLFKLADRFARKISLAQQSAQPSEIMNALQTAGLWDRSAEVAPIIATVGIPDEAKIAIDFTLDGQLNIKYNVAANVPIPPPLPPLDKNATDEEKAAYPAQKLQRDKEIAVAKGLQAKATAGALKLSNLLRAKYGAAVKAALAKGNIAVSGTMDVKWLTF